MANIRGKKHIILYTISGAALVGTIVLCANACNNGKETKLEKKEETEDTKDSVTTTVETTKVYNTTTNNDEKNTIVLEDLDEDFVTTSNTEYTEEIVMSNINHYDTTIPVDDTINTLLDVKNEKEVFTAHDVVERSTKLAEYINKNAVLAHDNYKFSTITAEDMYAPVFLANIDHVDDEVTAELIANGIIDENIEVNVANSFYFFELYADDTINKVMEGKTNILDLALLMGYEKDRKTAGTMNDIITGFVSNEKEVNRKNYLDTVYYYAEGVTVNKGDYSYASSIYETDRDRLAVGSDYTLSYAASAIDELAKMAGVATKAESAVMYEGRVDFSNLAQVFMNQCMQAGKSYTFTK